MLNFLCFGHCSTSNEEGGAYWQPLPTTKLRIFTFKELEKATGNFRRDGMLRNFGNVEVFKGWVDVKTLAPCQWGSGVAVCVMRPRPDDKNYYHNYTKPKSQVDFLKRLPHPNVIKLVGYCLKGKEQLLVHEFMQNGSLDAHVLRRDSSIEPISWDTRIKIAGGAARGLNFLHCAEKKVICRDFKLSNILLDGNYNAKISDFSCALLGPTGEEMFVETEVVIGTTSYIDPEYLATGRVHVKIDVYAFGVVLLELLTGSRVFDFFGQPEEEGMTLLERAMHLLLDRENMKTIMDVRMEGQYSIDAAFKAAQLILKCLGSKPQTRPSMTEVIEALEKIDNPKKEAPRNRRLNSISIQQIKGGLVN